MLKRVASCKLQFLNQPATISRRWAQAIASENPAQSIKKPKVPKIPKEATSQKPSKQVQKYFETENASILEQFPVKLLRNKQKTPDAFYVCHKNAVEAIVKHIKPIKDKSGKPVPLIEVNPGAGMLTKALLRKGFKDILLFESTDSLVPHLEAIVAKYSDRVKLKQDDFLTLWKLVYQDKMDNGDRVSQLLSDLTKQKWEEDLTAQVFAGVGNVHFMKHLINSIVFQNSLMSYGRCEMLLCMPPPLYIHLTCTNQAGYLMYRATTMLFQIMFEHEYLGKIPREYFLPWQISYDLEKKHKNKLAKVNSVDPDFLYLVRVVPRKELFELCSPEHMQALWYFIRQHSTSRKNRVIPMLERWIPGCGVRLITNTKPTIHPQPLKPAVIDSLPDMTAAATTMTTQDFYTKINIFTQFGDLSPPQMLTLFDQFHNWPEYDQQCPFVTAMETSFIKMEQSAEQNVDGIAEEEDADESHVKQV